MTGKDNQTVQDGQGEPLEDRPGTGRSGRAIVSPIVENASDLPSDRPCSDDCYTPLLHNADDDPGSSAGKRSGKRAGGCYQ